MSYSIESLSNNCYEGTTCLINKFNIRDEHQLAAVEADITLLKAAELEQNPIDGNFDFEHYRAIHKYLFEDLYDWAGEIRSINMSKKGTNFVHASEINDIAQRCFKRLKKENFFVGLPHDKLVENIVDFYCITNMLHAFREGNGRTQRIFITQLVQHAGYEINFSEIDTDELMIATIQAANGVVDLLKEIFRTAIKNNQKRDF